MKDRRRHERAAFFLAPGAHERIWVFKPKDELDARAGLILELSDSGLRILVDDEGPLDPGRFKLRLLPVDIADGDAADLNGELRLVWSEPDGAVGYLAGFSLEGESSGLLDFLRTHAPSAERRSWVRCLLRPIPSEA